MVPGWGEVSGSGAYPSAQSITGQTQTCTFTHTVTLRSNSKFSMQLKYSEYFLMLNKFSPGTWILSFYIFYTYLYIHSVKMYMPRKCTKIFANLCYTISKTKTQNQSFYTLLTEISLSKIRGVTGCCLDCKLHRLVFCIHPLSLQEDWSLTGTLQSSPSVLDDEKD